MNLKVWGWSLGLCGPCKAWHAVGIGVIAFLLAKHGMLLEKKNAFTRAINNCACLAALLWLSHLELVASGQLLAVPQKWDGDALLLVDMDFHVDGVAACLNGLDCPKWGGQSLEIS